AFAQDAPDDPSKDVKSSGTQAISNIRGEPTSIDIPIPGCVMLMKKPDPKPAPVFLGRVRPRFQIVDERDPNLTTRGKNAGDGKESGSGQIKLGAEINVRADSTAYNYYLQAKEAEANDDIVVALLFYKKALASFDGQAVKGDAKFRELIEHDQKS